MSAPAPIAVFAFRRPQHLENTLRALQACDGYAPQRVVVFCDGPRDERDLDAVEETRKVAQQVLGGQADYRFSEANRGLSASIIGGVSTLLESHGRVIVVEDDLQVAPTFLTYMDDALESFADAEDVYQVSGYMYDVTEFADRHTALFLPITVSWGWATWSRAWQVFDAGADGWEQLQHDAKLRRHFNVNGAYDFSAMLEKQMSGRADSWAIRWYWSVFRRSGKVLFPPVSLVRNTGMDGSGTHGRGMLARFDRSGEAGAGQLFDYPSETTVLGDDYNHARNAIWRQAGGVPGQVRRSLSRLLSSVTSG